MDRVRYGMGLNGLTPLVMNSNAGLLPDSGEAEAKGATRDKLAYERENFLLKTYRDGVGRLYIPSRAIKKALIQACKFVPDKPKGMRMQSFAPLIEAALLVEEDARLDVTADKVVPWTVIVNLDPSKGPRGPRGPRCRPLINLPWRAETTLTVLDAALTAAALGKIAAAAGLKVGVGDARSIDMGRADVTITELG